LSAISPHDVAALQELADFVRERATFLFSQRQATREFKFIGGRVGGLTQKREEAITK